MIVDMPTVHIPPTKADGESCSPLHLMSRDRSFRRQTNICHHANSSVHAVRETWRFVSDSHLKSRNREGLAGWFDGGSRRGGCPPIVCGCTGGCSIPHEHSVDHVLGAAVSGLA